MEKLKIMVDEGAYTPTRAHEWDAGLDIISPVTDAVYPGDSHVFDTGVHVQIPEGYVGMIKSRSGMNTKHDVVCEGVIDAGYTGSIRVCLRNLGCGVYCVNRGDRIAQLVIMPIAVPEVEVVDSFEQTVRGDNGFGSTGR